MGKSQTSGKKDREKKRLQKRDEKEKKKEERKATSSKGKDFEDMLAYIDENGNLTSTKPDPLKKRIIRADDILISVPRQENIQHDADAVKSGIVTFFNTEKGYGFIKDQETQQSIFVHMSGLEGPVTENDKVNFKIEMSQRGPNAVNVKKS